LFKQIPEGLATITSGPYYNEHLIEKWWKRLIAMYMLQIIISSEQKIAKYPCYSMQIMLLDTLVYYYKPFSSMPSIFIIMPFIQLDRVSSTLFSTFTVV